MYYSYSYYSMKPKADMIRSTYISSTSYSDYNSWKSKIDGYSADPWRRLCDRYAEDMQFAILKGITVAGIIPLYWNDLFKDILNENIPFKGIVKQQFQGQLSADWHFFANKIAKETTKSIHYPVGCPEWLFPYGYTQQQYLQDLAVYWDNIHDDYYKPWETTQLGEDSPEIARLKKISQTAQLEIDQVAKHSTGYAQR